MIAIYFNFVHENGEPSEWYGLAIGHNWTEIFWEIDKYGNPFECVISLNVNMESICFRDKMDDFDNDLCDASKEFDEDSMDCSPIGETRERFKWIKPVWVREKEFGKTPYKHFPKNRRLNETL